MLMRKVIQLFRKEKIMTEVVTVETYRIVKQVPRRGEDGQPVMEPQPDGQPIDTIMVEDYVWQSSPPQAPIGARVQSLTIETGLVHIATLISSEKVEV